MDNQCIRDISADDPVDPGDLEEADLGIIDGGDGDHPLSASEEVTPRNGVHIPPFLNLNLDRDSGVDIPQVQTPLTLRGSDVGVGGGRRSSVVIETMLNSGAIQGGLGSGEINLDNMSAFDIKAMYASFQQSRRPSIPSNDFQDFGHSESFSESLSSENETSGYTPSCRTCLWQEPTFTSKILEAHLKKKVIQFLQRRYRIALIFIGLFSLLWVVFFSIQLPSFDYSNSDTTKELTSDTLAIGSVKYSTVYITGGMSLFLIAILFLFATYLKFYSKIAQILSVMLTMILMIASCALAIALHLDHEGVRGISTISFVAQFAITATVILVVYTLSRLRLWLSAILCMIYILVLEVLVGTLNGRVQSNYLLANISTISSTTNTDYNRLFHAAVVSRMFFYVCLNISGITTAYLTQSRLHDTYWRIGQCVLAKKQMDSERDIGEKTINSMMPKFLAKELLDVKAQIPYIVKIEINSFEDNVPPILKNIVIPFTVRKMNRVSILFADIVGFTKFSSCLTATELVGILNNLFSEFDELALKTKCETISTLGDCYFCVSGCPKPDASHSDNCVEMGLQIIKFLEEYSKHRIEMRVGIHTGSVLCGVMGTQRFRFDVWSHDVTTANRIESVSKPGRVLVSSSTKLYLSIVYTTEEATDIKSTPELSKYRLYFVKRARDKTNIGNSKVAWRQRIRNIDTMSKGGNEPSEDSCQEHSEGDLNMLLRRRQSLATSVQEEEIKHSSFRDSLSRQSRIQRCVSYVDIANPQVEQQVLLDKKIVTLMDEEDVTFDSYFDSRLHLVWASFGNKALEREYRRYGRDVLESRRNTSLGTELGFELTKLSYLTDVVSLLFIFILIMVGAAINFSGFSHNTAFTQGSAPLYQSWLIIFIVGLVIETALLICVIAIYAPHKFPVRFSRFSSILINWYCRSFVAIFLIYFPMTMVIISLTQCYGTGFSSVEDLLHVQMSFYITIVVLVSSVNFMDVSYIAKVVGGVLSATLTVCLVAGIHLESCINKLPDNKNSIEIDNRTVPIDTEVIILRNYYNRHVAPEATILLLLILCLLTVVNRMSEVSVRLSFLGRIRAAEKKLETHQQKNQVEWLLYNIIPSHVALDLRKTGKYSCNHDCIGVVFASIVNFSEFSNISEEEESFRLLNRIVREFDMLLNRPEFSHVEKIKTIGSTYMAASGLNLPKRTDHVVHLLQLIDFALQLGKTLSSTSLQAPSGFSFLLRVGFNYGPVTSGVVGSRKLMYDIWGDTVNVSSRMDTMGEVCKVHMPEYCLELLKDYIKWEPNRVINVKGKGEMATVFVTGRQKKLTI